MDEIKIIIEEWIIYKIKFKRSIDYAKSKSQQMSGLYEITTEAKESEA